MKKIKTIIVDDSAVIRELFSEMLADNATIEVVATAEDPYDAREKIKRYNPDVITLDVEMPKMDGISFLEKIMTLRPMPVVMISSLTTKGADITLRALELGAADYIAKPESIDEHGYKRLKESLIHKIKCAANIRTNSINSSTTNEALRYTGLPAAHLIAIGASTGGVEALRDVLKCLPANIPPVVITQHMPEIFTATFAKRMDNLAAPSVWEAKNKQKIEPGNVYIAPGNHHLAVKMQGSELYCQVFHGEAVSGHQPSVDVLFNSVSKITGKKMVGVILTGMGHDGANGLLKMRTAGARTIGQSEASCVVYGMPKAAREIGAVEQEITLADIPKRILQLCATQGDRYAV